MLPALWIFWKYKIADIARKLVHPIRFWPKLCLLWRLCSTDSRKWEPGWISRPIPFRISRDSEFQKFQFFPNRLDIQTKLKLNNNSYLKTVVKNYVGSSESSIDCSEKIPSMNSTWSVINLTRARINYPVSFYL